MNRILPGPFRWQQVMWLLVVVGGFAATGWHLSLLVERYLEYPTSTTVLEMHLPWFRMMTLRTDFALLAAAYPISRRHRVQHEWRNAREDQV